MGSKDPLESHSQAHLLAGIGPLLLVFHVLCNLVIDAGGLVIFPFFSGLLQCTCRMR